MDFLIYVFIAATLVAATLASLAIWAPRVARVRWAALGVAALFIPLSYVLFLEFLSKPKPKGYEWFEANVEEAEVLGVSLSEGEAIYMWLRLDGAIEPRYYVFPWDLRLAERLEEDVDNAINRNSKLVIKNPFNRRPGEPLGDLNLEIIPPPLMPLKKPRVPPRIFNPRGQEA
ncbi:MAG: hypothetical protein OXR84_09345 [Magnetovibrio sp.]|nr:hypothetical protein [Magnetovibrio sp.]